MLFHILKCWWNLVDAVEVDLNFCIEILVGRGGLDVWTAEVRSWWLYICLLANVFMSKIPVPRLFIILYPQHSCYDMMLIVEPTE